VLLVAQPGFSATINIISTDSQMKEKILQIDDSELANNFSELFNAIETSVATKLDSKKSAESLHLTGVKVGLGISGEIGIGPFNIGAAIMQNLKFVRKNIEE
jgi:hypothetical protein